MNWQRTNKEEKTALANRGILIVPPKGSRKKKTESWERKQGKRTLVRLAKRVYKTARLTPEQLQRLFVVGE